MSAMSDDELKIFIITGEPSGDALGAPLMSAIAGLSPRPVRFSGVGGDQMAQEGLKSLFSLTELALMGGAEIIAKLPRILGLIRQTADAIIAENPDILVLIDSPDFTHTVAKRVRKRLPGLKVVNYVSPTVWAWRSGRAKRMRRYINRVLAIFPFEVAAHERLSGPPCVYVGHPLIDSVTALRGEGDRLQVSANPKILVMPGSRSSEIKRLMAPFGDALARIHDAIPNLEIILPVAPAVRALVERKLVNWRVRPTLVYTQTEKLDAFRRADAAMVASGTATLELALARVPMVAAYRIEWMATLLQWMVNVPSVLLPNLIAGTNFVPELIHKNCTVDKLVAETIPLLTDEKTRQQQFDGFEIVSRKLAIDGDTPSRRAAAEILQMIP